MQDDWSDVAPFDRQDVLPTMTPWISLGRILLLGAGLASLSLLAILQINIQVKAPGYIRPDQPIQSVQARIDGTIARLEVAENEKVKRGQTIAYLDIPDLFSLENQYQTAQAELDQIKAQHQALTAQVEALNYTVLTAIPEFVSQPSPLDSQEAIEAALAKLMQQNPEQANHYLNQYRELHQVLESINQQVRDRQASVLQLRHQIEQKRLVASTDGTILQLMVHNPGETVHQGMEVARIVPSNTTLVIKAAVAVQDIGQVEVGQLVQMQVSAYPYPDYGILQGKVIAIAPDSTPCEQPYCSGTMVYQVVVEPDRNTLTRGDRSYPLQPGMEVKATIISHRQRLLTWLFHQLNML